MIKLNKSSSKICKDCKINCCRKNTIPYLTKKEREIHKIEGEECSYFSNNKCQVYKNRPIDCKIFPISIYKQDNKFYWILEKNCPLSKKLNIEEEIKLIEKKYLPSLKNELEEYHNHPWSEWFQQFDIIKEIKLNKI
jgi:Fe-S-cluster containining protein